MASAVTTPLERQFGQMPSLAQMTSRVELRQLADHAAVRPRSQHRRRRAGRAGGDQRGVEPPAAHAADAADLQQEQPRRHADPHARASAPTRCRSTRSTTTPTRSSRRRSRRSPGVGPRHARTAGRSRRCACRSIRWRSRGSGSALEDVRTALAPANVNQPKGNLDGPRQNYTLATERSARQGRRRSSRSSSPTRTARRCASPTSRTSSTASRTRSSPAGPNDKRAIILNVQRQPGANVIEVAERVKALLPAAPGVAAAGHRRDDPHRPHRDGARLGRRRRVHARSSRSAWSSPSSTSSCATCARRSSPASPCRCRSSAPSA